MTTFFGPGELVRVYRNSPAQGYGGNRPVFGFQATSYDDSGAPWSSEAEGFASARPVYPDPPWYSPLAANTENLYRCRVPLPAVTSGVTVVGQVDNAADAWWNGTWIGYQFWDPGGPFTFAVPDAALIQGDVNYLCIRSKSTGDDNPQGNRIRWTVEGTGTGWYVVG